MASSRRTFLRRTGFVGGVLGSTALQQANGRDARSDIPTSRAKALMAAFGLRYPIFQAPHGPAAGPQLAAAVSNAGAMGTMALTGVTRSRAGELVKMASNLTKRSFITNYLLAWPPESLASALNAGAPIVQFSWGLPSKTAVSVVRNARAKLGLQVGNSEGARAALDLGADYLVCQGTEAGGHVQSSTPLYELLPAILDEAGKTPVVVAGGIATGQMIRKALLAGASGAVLGPRFLATKESLAHPEYKDAIVRAHANDTALSVCFQNEWPNAMHRALRNRTFVLWEAAGCPGRGKRPGEGDILATKTDGGRVARYSFDMPMQGFEGTISELVMYAGRGVGDVKDVPAAGELVARLWAECVAH
jgi:nitronate monooxygenase